MMKFLILFPMLLLLIIETSCTKDQLEITANDLLGKWEINDSENVQSIEFNESNSFIIEEKNQNGDITFQYGIYEIVDESSVSLLNYGTLTRLIVTSSGLDFEIEKNGGGIIEYSSTEVLESISSSEVSELLCQTWNLLSVDEIKLTDVDEVFHVVFSQVGTYLVADVSLDEHFISFWKWKDDLEEILCYARNVEPTCEDNKSQVRILELTANKLVINDLGKVYDFEPLNN